MKRSFFRFHLATMVVGSIVCGALIWANVRQLRHVERVAEFSSTKLHSSFGGDLGHSVLIYFARYGWPLVCYDEDKEMRAEYARPFSAFDDLSVTTQKQDHVSAWDWTAFEVDLFVNVAMVGLAMVLCEWVMRRRGNLHLSAAPEIQR